MIPLQSVVIAFVAVAALATVLARDVVRQALVLSFYGFGLVALLVVLQAPDVALSALVVSGVAYPVVLLAAIGRAQRRRKR